MRKAVSRGRIVRAEGAGGRAPLPDAGATTKSDRSRADARAAEGMGTACTLTVRIHRMTCPAHDKAVGALLGELTQAAFLHPETGARLIYELA